MEGSAFPESGPPPPGGPGPKLTEVCRRLVALTPSADSPRAPREAGPPRRSPTRAIGPDIERAGLPDAIEPLHIAQ